MFEQEIELEKKQGSALPLLLMVGLIIALVGVAAYFLGESRKVLTTTEATSVMTKILSEQLPVTTKFEVGTVTDSWDEGPTDPHYRLLAKAGILKIGKGKGNKIPVALTEQGKNLVQQIPGVKQTKDEDGNVTYVVPLATRKLVEISKVEMDGPLRATVQYSWKWQPNAIGETFDASGTGVQGFNSWDRAKLIDKFGARFYHEAPEKVSMALLRGEQGWQAASN